MIGVLAPGGGAAYFESVDKSEQDIRAGLERAHSFIL